MNTTDFSLNFNEKVMFELRSLFSKRGYSQYKMSKFEEYDLYARNKDFLISDSIITFTDTDGKLMALKPDVTLSIIKNTKDLPDTVQKVYYNENVYRIAKGTNSYKEIMQVGLECFGDIDDYSICEVVTLASSSLKTISDNCVLDISHLGIITALLDKFDIHSTLRKDVIKLIGEKNAHELTLTLKENGLSDNEIEILKTLVTASGKKDEVLPYLKNLLSNIIDTSFIDEFAKILDSLDDNIADIIRVDFSVVSDTHYYNSIVFKGFIEGVPTSVLSGGQYDKLMEKMKQKSKAIGFAVYLDGLDRLSDYRDEYDVDCIVIYDDKTKLSVLNKETFSIINNGETVYACKSIPSRLKYKKIVNLTDSEVDTNENNA